jgi:hypothetical protein
MSKITENENNYVCEKCKKTYLSKSSFYYHKKRCFKDITKISQVPITELHNNISHIKKQDIITLIENNNKLIENNKIYYEQNQAIYLSNNKILINLLKYL